MSRSSERGSAIIMLFIMVALFGLLAFAFLRGTKSNVSWIQSEQTKAATTSSQDCTNAVNMGVKRLEARGCGSLISYNNDGSNSNAGAPTDGSCSVFHANGGGVKPCNASAVAAPCTNAQLAALSVGQGCGDAVYAGNTSGHRVYAARADSGNYAWLVGSLPTPDRQTDWNDGLAATNAILAYADGRTYPAAQACRALGAQWYLPSRDEMSDLAYSYNTGELAGTFNTSASYWTSSENHQWNALQHYDITNPYAGNDLGKTNTARVRCVRK